MWPIATLDNEIITFTFSCENISCCWISQSTKDNRYVINEYQTYDLTHLELENLIIFNPTHIKKIITDFLSKHKHNNAFVAFSLQGQSIAEEYVTLPISSPKREDFGIAQSSNFLWEYHYLYQNIHGQFTFYVYKIPQFLLLQYKLLAIAAQCNLITITTHSIALFSCYKNIYAHSFRQSQFALDMENNRNNPEKLISIEELKRTLALTDNLFHEYIAIATHYGLMKQGMNI